MYKEFHKSMLEKNDGRAVNHSLQDFMRENVVSAEMHFMSRTARSTLWNNVQNSYIYYSTMR